jgi:hypothetical protein
LVARFKFMAFYHRLISLLLGCGAA